MASQGHLHPSQSRKRFSREGFQPLPTESASNMAPNDATIDIPLEQVNSTASSGGLRSGSATAGLVPQQTDPSATAEKHHFFRGRRAKPDPSAQKTGHVGYDGEEDVVTTMGRIYSKFYGFSIITRYFVYVAPVGLLIAIPIIVCAIIQNNRSSTLR